MITLAVPAEDGNHSGGVVPSWLTYEQASTYANLSRCTLWRAINEGELDAAKIGRAVRIPMDSLDDFMRSRCVPR